MEHYQLVLDSAALLERLKIPAIRDSYPSRRLMPVIKRAYLRYLRRFSNSIKPGAAGCSPVSGFALASGMGQEDFYLSANAAKDAGAIAEKDGAAIAESPHTITSGLLYHGGTKPIKNGDMFRGEK
jgi:hypothetical protein